MGIGIIPVFMVRMMRMTRLVRVATRTAARATSIMMRARRGGAAPIAWMRRVCGLFRAMLQSGSVVVAIAGIARFALDASSQMRYSGGLGLCLAECREIHRNIASLGSELGITRQVQRVPDSRFL